MSESLPANPDAQFNEGLDLHQKGQVDAAEAVYRRVLMQEPMHFDARHMLGVIAIQRRDFGRAVELIGMAISVNPHNPLYADAYCNRGTAFRALGKNDEAVTCFSQAIKLKPTHADAYFNRANAYRDLNRGAEALADFQRAAQLAPNNAEAAFNRALSLTALNRPAAAVSAFEEAQRLKPDQPYLEGLRLFEKLRLSNWTGLSAEIAAVAAAIGRGARATPPYSLLTFSNDPALQARAAEIWTSDRFPAMATALPKPPAHDRIRIGYFCEAFRNHSVSQQIATVFENHDRRRFEIFAFSYGPRVDDAMQHRISAAVDHFVDISGETDTSVVLQARMTELDIAVDLTGHTGNARTGIFAQRVAPVQINAIGYPGTMGADYFDYILADSTVIPEGDREHYREKVIYMPDCYHAAEYTNISIRKFTRAEMGLPSDGIVFCSLDGNGKILPAIFASWMRILKAIPGSVLMLTVDNAPAMDNLRSEAAAFGVAPDQLAFTAAVSPVQYAARFRAADLYLDTLPHNAGIPAVDALAAGLPLLTCAGDTFVGRMGASRLKAIGLPELIAENAADYEHRAIALAKDPRRLSELKQKISANIATTALFDTGRYAAQLEDAYMRVHSVATAGLRAEHVFV